MGNQPPKIKKFLEGVIENVGDDFVIIKTADGQKLRWPKKDLQNECQLNAPVKIAIFTEQEWQEDKETLAKNILNQLLKAE